jgi:hypothetical protein
MVGWPHGENLSVLVHSPPKDLGLPRGRCDVEPPGIAIAADEQIEYRGLRRRHTEDAELRLDLERAAGALV